MPSITNWLMVGITAVYVIATIFICRANIKSAEETRKQTGEMKRQFEETKRSSQQQLEAMHLQLEESKRQYEETRRLDIMPYLQIKIMDRLSFPDTRLELDILDDATDEARFKEWCVSGCELRNIGRGTAKDIDCDSSGGAITNMGIKFRTTALQSGSAQTMNIILSARHAIDEPLEVHLVMYYKDLLDHTYRQVIELDIVKRAKSEEFLILNCTTHSPELLLDK